MWIWGGHKKKVSVYFLEKSFPGFPSNSLENKVWIFFCSTSNVKFSHLNTGKAQRSCWKQADFDHRIVKVGEKPSKLIWPSHPHHPLTTSPGTSPNLSSSTPRAGDSPTSLGNPSQRPPAPSEQKRLLTSSLNLPWRNPRPPGPAVPGCRWRSGPCRSPTKRK